MYSYERPYWQAGKIVCGIDEAGRGPLAGPVCAAAVILDPGYTIEGLNDSKKLSAKKPPAKSGWMIFLSMQLNLHQFVFSCADPQLFCML